MNGWPAVVAVPARNEAERLGACLTALAQQRDVPAPEVLLFLNNTTDHTGPMLAGLLPSLPLRVTVAEHHFALAQQSAGHARRRAMELAAGLAGPGGVILCTDADGRAAPDWLAANLWHLRHGADAVAGRAEIDPAEAALIPAALHDDDARECAYAAALDELDSLLDPDPADPWPRHTEHSGASICVTPAAFRRAGGVPAVPLGEDRAFYAALRRVDARIRHAPEVCVTVSGRLVGRAAGGMADTIRRRMAGPDPYLDDRLEPAAQSARRSALRRRMRVERIGPGFGAFWAAYEAEHLPRQLVPMTALAAEMAQAQALLDAARSAQPQEHFERAVEQA